MSLSSSENDSLYISFLSLYQKNRTPPDQFIVPAEQTGLIRPLTLWVIEAAIRQCRVWGQEGRAFPISVNVSARNLIDPQLPDQIARLLQTHDISPRRLELEITESAIMADPAKAMEILTHFNRIGIALSIDDFGTGYSSLGYLKRLPVDTIKIDKSFVKNMTADENDAMIVRSTIDLGHNLGLRVIAEGVENQEIWDKLVALGCDAVQGYYISRPIPAAELERWLAEVAPQKGWTIGTMSGDKEASGHQIQ
jgi:EAL domain-containing protein (putative c-di-GMP-specific phosphodiesterase class I)